jgi:predicted nucleic acid-binding protein
MGQTVCLDTDVCILGIKEEGSPEQVAKAKNFLEHLDDKGAQVIIPSVVVAELLVRVPPGERPTIVNYLYKHFLVMPFDIQASTLYASLWQERYTGELREQRLKTNKTRSGMKMDFLVVSIAIAKDASCIYTENVKDLKPFANGRIEVREMPEILRQGHLEEMDE